MHFRYRGTYLNTCNLSTSPPITHSLSFHHHHHHENNYSITTYHHFLIFSTLLSLLCSIFFSKKNLVVLTSFLRPTLFWQLRTLKASFKTCYVHKHNQSYHMLHIARYLRTYAPPNTTCCALLSAVVVGHW